MMSVTHMSALAEWVLEVCDMMIKAGEPDFSREESVLLYQLYLNEKEPDAAFKTLLDLRQGNTP